VTFRPGDRVLAAPGAQPATVRQLLDDDAFDYVIDLDSDPSWLGTAVAAAELTQP
jgi:hypothetical protein